MTPAALIRSLFPRPRHRLTGGGPLVLIAFLAGFAGACVLVEASGLLLFTSRKAFLLAALLPWVWWQHRAGLSGLRGLRALAALLVRLGLVALLIVLLAEPRALRKSNALSLMYALDVSDSIGDNASDSALAFIAGTVTKKPPEDEAGLVVFGRDAAVELAPRTSFPFEAINSRIGTDGTNIENALSLAAAMIPDDRAGRIVLISDGTETEGNLGPVLGELSARKVPVDVLPVQYDYDREVWLEKLELPRFVKAGETYEASVVLSSLAAGSATLVLRENGRIIYEGRIDYEAGKNRYSLPLYLREPGYYEYVATVQPPPGQDGWQENNKAVGYLYLKGEGKILLVTDPAGDERDWRPLLAALRQSRFVVEAASAYEFPRDALSLMPYDCVVFPNVPADAVDAVQMQALHDAVYSQGMGFLMVGGQNSFGPGGYHRTVVEKALPVSMDISQKRVLPKGALVIILHTCEFPEGNTWGKRVAKEAVRVLGAQDEVGALAYDHSGGQKWLFPLTPAAEYERLVTLINQADIGDMPSFETTMRMGLDALKASDAAAKHMIIISDGDPSPPTPDLLKAFAEAKVSVSTVVVFPHPDDRGVSVMKAVAQATGGRFYYPQDARLLPAIFIKEAKTLKRSMIQNVTFVPEAVAPSPVLKGIETMRPLRGYVLTTPKERALTVLKGPETEQVDPVLAVWRYGLGKTAAFTSDLSTNWAAEWIGWDRYQPFVKQLVTEVSRVEHESFLEMRCFATGTTGTVYVEDVHPQGGFLRAQAQVAGPHGRSEELELKQSGPRRYEGQFPLWGEGRYQVVAAGAADGRSEQVVGGFVVAYSPEYLRFRSNPIVLERIAKETGGRLLSGTQADGALFPKDREPRVSSRPIAGLFLLALACLLPLDVGVRRVQLDWALLRSLLGARARQPDQTLEALLRRKKAIQLPRFEKAPGRPAAPRPAAGAEPGAAAERRKRPVSAQPAAQEPGAGEVSTTGRLLALKKKWKDKQQQKPER